MYNSKLVNIMKGVMTANVLGIIAAFVCRDQEKLQKFSIKCQCSTDGKWNLKKGAAAVFLLTNLLVSVHLEQPSQWGPSLLW